MRVLIVDDDPAILRATARGLGALGWVVSTSPIPVPPIGVDVVLTDWNPYGPKMLELCLFEAVPVVVFTGTPDTVGEPVTVIPKPCDAAALDRALRGAR